MTVATRVDCAYCLVSSDDVKPDGIDGPKNYYAESLTPVCDVGLLD